MPNHEAPRPESEQNVAAPDSTEPSTDRQNAPQSADAEHPETIKNKGGAIPFNFDEYAASASDEDEEAECEMADPFSDAAAKRPKFARGDAGLFGVFDLPSEPTSSSSGLHRDTDTQNHRISGDTGDADLQETHIQGFSGKKEIKEHSQVNDEEIFEEIEAALSESRQYFSDNWRSPGWDFGFHLRGIDAFKSLDEFEFVKIIDRWIQSRIDSGFYDSAEEAWQHEFKMSAEDGRMELLAVWGKMKFAPGFGLLDYALSQAEKDMSVVPNAISEKYVLFVKVAKALQTLNADENIFLPTHTIGDLLGVTHQSVATYCGIAIRQGYLRLVKKAVLSQVPRNRRAAEYRFIGDPLLRPAGETKT